MDWNWLLVEVLAGRMDPWEVADLDDYEKFDVYEGWAEQAYEEQYGVFEALEEQFA